MNKLISNIRIIIVALRGHTQMLKWKRLILESTLTNWLVILDKVDYKEVLKNRIGYGF